MKKILSITVLLISILLLTGCGSSNDKYLEDISYDELKELVENKETFILEVYQDGCSHCAVFTPRFKKVLKEYNITAKAINFAKITQEEYDEFSLEYGKNIGTPTVMFFVEGNEKTKINRLVGEPSEKEIIRKLKQNGYIEE